MGLLIKFVRHLIHSFFLNFFPKFLISRAFRELFGYSLDWKNPKNINEKIQWLLIYSDISEWSRLADKYTVRDYVKEKGLEHILVRLYGVWDKPEQINYKYLPDKFVLKCNHDSGSTIIVDGKKEVDYEAICEKLNKSLKLDYGYRGELHYRSIKRRIIAEEYLQVPSEDRNLSTSIIDYKVWCFNGIPRFIGVYYDRTDSSVKYDYYDTDWQLHNEYILSKGAFIVGDGRIKKPVNLTELLNIASILSDGFPEVRVDFYIHRNKIYFGEMTFTSSGGMISHYTPEFLKILGDYVILPSKK